jgi:XrtJ-associated TM-motif-TM protein
MLYEITDSKRLMGTPITGWNLGRFSKNVSDKLVDSLPPSAIPFVCITSTTLQGVDTTMKMKTVLFLGVLFAMAAVAHAQGGTVSSGCDSSPENPTAILALVGSATGVVVALRDRFRRRR